MAKRSDANRNRARDRFELIQGDLPAQASPVVPEDPALFLNRELSQLEFHRRVLAQASDPRSPLLERFRFLTISSAILDEFFEIRVAGLKGQVAFGLGGRGPDGLGAQETLSRIRAVVSGFVAEQYRLFNDVLLPELASAGIAIHRRDDWSAGIGEWVAQYFGEAVLPVLTPLGLDPAHPFPRILNKSLNFYVSLSGKDAFGRQSRGAVIQAPRVLPRLIRVPQEISKGPHDFVMLSSVIHAHVERLFPGMKVTGCHQFRVTRNSDLWIDEEEVEDLLLALKGELPQRHYGDSVRLEVSDTLPEETTDFLLEEFALSKDDLYRVNGPVNVHRLEALYDLVDRPELKYPRFLPGFPRRLENESDLFLLLRQRDILLHHPYQSFAPVVGLLRQAAKDPSVLAIKQTLYRTGAGSAVGEALLDAARAGKEVTAIVELRARFDEAANIELASRLQEAGARVVYGIVGFKAHAKLLLIVRREEGKLRRYVHLGTGNYNPQTAREYTDISLMSCDPTIGEDVHEVFQQFTGLGRVGKLTRLVQTPFGLHERVLECIAAEAEEARRGKKSRILAKVNSLSEPRIIRALYDASQAGVPIDLIVRGICCLRPGVAGLSENIRVRSIVGRFLEHHRVFHFHAGGESVTLCSSADWMPRNLFRRVEVSFPVEGKHERRVLREALEIPLEDNCTAWEMQSDGSYRRVEPAGAPPFDSQAELLRLLAKLPG